ncbi:MAG: hypothetical protein V4628_12095 [Pseudomonadota bacterium]
MRLAGSARYFLHAALLLLVLAGVGNIHSHQCLDGQEPAVSVHFENLSGHPDHEGDEVHVDVETELAAQLLPAKPVDQDSPLFLTACLFVFCVRPAQKQHYLVKRDSHFYQAPSYLQPPQRAPPHHSS